MHMGDVRLCNLRTQVSAEIRLSQVKIGLGYPLIIFLHNDLELNYITKAPKQHLQTPDSFRGLYT
jgi:hypothetical protein